MKPKTCGPVCPCVVINTAQPSANYKSSAFFSFTCQSLNIFSKKQRPYTTAARTRRHQIQSPVPTIHWSCSLSSALLLPHPSQKCSVNPFSMSTQEPKAVNLHEGQCGQSITSLQCLVSCVRDHWKMSHVQLRGRLGGDRKINRNTR